MPDAVTCWLTLAASVYATAPGAAYHWPLWSPSFWEFTQLDFKILLLLCCVMLLMSEESVSKFTGEVNTVISPSAIYNMTCCRTRSETCNSPNKCVSGTRWRYLYLLWIRRRLLLKSASLYVSTFWHLCHFKRKFSTKQHSACVLHRSGVWLRDNHAGQKNTHCKFGNILRLLIK